MCLDRRQPPDADGGCYYSRPFFDRPKTASCPVKAHLQELISQALLDLKRKEFLSVALPEQIGIERTRSDDHGDFSSNVAMVLGKQAKTNPRALAEQIVKHLPTSKHVLKVEIAGPGFINFFQTPGSLQTVIKHVLNQGHEFGRARAASREKITLEYVSANPTGPLHVGHGRGAAYGATLASLLEARGFEVQREYYVNDNGRQMDILAASVWLRYLELCGERVRFPDNAYKGEYVFEVARELRNIHGDDFRHSGLGIEDGLPADESQGGDKDRFIDAMIERAKKLLGERSYRVVFDAGLNAILEDIRQDLSEFGVQFDDWFSERGLATSGDVERALKRLADADLVYEKDGAQWFKATQFGDDLDRVVVRENGASTYFASDVAYLLNKLERGFDKLIYVFGADHHGYIARLKACAQGLGADPNRIEVKLIQFAVLYRGGVKVQMSTRSGSFVTLRELREEVGTDAARFFYVMRSHDQHLDFDLDLAKSESNDNPVFYVQMAHARIGGVLRQLDEKMLSHNRALGDASIALLGAREELSLLKTMSRYPEVLELAAESRSPHVLSYYLRDLAHDFHSFYDAHKLLIPEEGLRNARLNLSLAVKQILRNGLELLGVGAPERM